MSDTIPARIQWLRKVAATIEALLLRQGEAALKTDTEVAVLGDGSTTGGKWTLVMVPLSGLTEGDMIQWRSGKWARVPRQSAVSITSSALSAVTGTDGSGGAGDAAAKTDVDTAFTEINKIRTDLENLRDSLKVTGGAGILQDS